MTMDLTDTYAYFFDDDAFEATTRPGFRRRVITGEKLQLCFWRIRGGVEGSYLHQHEDHEQLGIIMRGAVGLRLGEAEGERTLLHAGDIYLAPTRVWHGDSEFIGDDELDECWILDVFSPPRDDLREAMAQAEVIRADATDNSRDNHGARS